MARSSDYDQAVDDVVQAWRRVRPIARAGAHLELRELAEKLNQLDGMHRFELDTSG